MEDRDDNVIDNIEDNDDDALIKKFAGILVDFGIPGMIFFYVAAGTGLTGAAAITAALAATGPFGVISGIITLGVVGIFATAGYSTIIDKGYEEQVIRESLIKYKEKKEKETGKEIKWEEIGEETEKTEFISSSKKEYLLRIVKEYEQQERH